MKTSTQKTMFPLLIMLIFHIYTLSLFGQNIWHPSLGTVVTGDLMHAATGNDFIGVVYSRTGNVYYNAILSNGEWSGEELLGEGTQAKITIDAANHPHVVFTTNNKIGYTLHDGSNWTAIAYIESNFAGNCSRPDITVDGSGFAHITYTDTKGNTGDYTDKPDIMYAVNSSGSFVKTLIFKGFYEFLGGADALAEYYDKGSCIALDGAGNYFILSHRYGFNKWMGGSDKSYSVVVKSNTASGGTAVSSSDAYQLYDLEFNGTNVLALYKDITNKTASFAVNDAAITFTNPQDITLLATPGSLSANTSNTVIGGISASNLFTKYNSLEHKYTNVTVKGDIVSVVNVAGVFYSIYTDNADGKIKIRQVATPLSFTSFELAGQTSAAVIDQTSSTIHIEVAKGTDKTNIIPTFLTTSDASSIKINDVQQTSGTSSNNFTSPVIYTIGDGTNTRSWTVNVTEKIYTKINDIKEEGFIIYPNPSTDMIYINGIKEETQIHIFDITGRKVKTQKLNGGKIDISHLMNGAYVISFETGTGSFSGRILKN